MNIHFSCKLATRGDFMKIHKIIMPTPYPIGDVNSFLVKEDTLSIFDVGPKTKEAYESLKSGIREAGYELSDIEQVILTHHHPDHAGWVDAFPNAKILGHEYVDHWLRKTDSFLAYQNDFYRTQFRLAGVSETIIKLAVENNEDMQMYGTLPLTGMLKGGDRVPGHPSLKTYYTPGHAQSHLLFVDEKTNSAFGGDLLLERVASNPLVEPPVDLSTERPKSLLQYHESLKWLRDLRLTKMYIGHGNDIDNITELIDMRLEKDIERAKKVLLLLNEPKTVYEMTKQLYPSAYKLQLGLTLSKTIGELDLLEIHGYVQKELQNGVEIYSRVRTLQIQG